MSNDFEVQDQLDGLFVTNQGLTNVFDFRQKVFGLYGTGSFESDKWGIKLGLRREHTNIKTNLINSNLSNNRDFADLFPTFHSSFKFDKKTISSGGIFSENLSSGPLAIKPFF